MNYAVYFSHSRAIVLQFDIHGWQLVKVLNLHEEGLARLQQWFNLQARRTVTVLLDWPDDELILHELPQLAAWQRWRLVRSLAARYRQNHVLSCSLCNRLERVDTQRPESVVLRHFALGQQCTDSACVAVLGGVKSKIKAIYSANLLAEQCLPSNDATRILLCTTVGEDKLRHSFFNHGLLCFTRVLDMHQHASQLEQQLADTQQYLQEQFPTEAAGADIQVLRAVTNDVLVADQTIAGNANVGSSSSEDFATLYKLYRAEYIGRSDVGSYEVTQAQLRLFDFLAEQLSGTQQSVSLKRYRLHWRESRGLQQTGKLMIAGLSSQRVRNLALLGGQYLIGAGSVCLLLLAVLFYRDAKLKQAQFAAQQAELEKQQSQLPASVVAPATMQEYVLLNQSLVDNALDPVALLASLAQSVTQSPQIILNELSWTLVSVTEINRAKAGASISPAMRQELTLEDGKMGESQDVLLRMSGQIAMLDSSISEAYSAFQRFSDRLAADPDWKLFEIEQAPFDSAIATAVAGDQQAGSFSLLLKSVRHR